MKRSDSAKQAQPASREHPDVALVRHRVLLELHALMQQLRARHVLGDAPAIVQLRGQLYA